MMVIGVDPHKRSHTAAAIEATTGELRGSETVAASKAGHELLLRWGRGLARERVWAIEDCRHVSASLERFLLARGERVARVAPKLMALARGAERERGKSDPIDALAVARAALREGPENLPQAFLDERALELKLLLDHREDLVGERTRIQNRLRWHLHELWPELGVPSGALDRLLWLDRIARRLARAEQSVRVQVTRDQLRRLRELARSCAELELQIAAQVDEQAPAMLSLHGCGALTAAKLVAETAGARRFSTDAQFARLSGVAPIPVSSGRRDRHRLDRGGNRQLNCALHRIAVVQGRDYRPARDYLAKKQAEGKSRKEALRCLKRQLARVVFGLLKNDQPPPPTSALTPPTQHNKMGPPMPSTPNPAIVLT